MRNLACLLALLLLGATPVEEAELALGQLRDEMAEITADVEEAWADVERTREELRALHRTEKELELEIATTSAAVRDYAVFAYKHLGGTDIELRQFFAEGSTLEHVTSLTVVQRHLRLKYERASASRNALERTRHRLELTRDEHEIHREELSEQGALLEERLALAESALTQARENERLEAERRERLAREREEARAAQASQATQQAPSGSPYACPLDRRVVSFANSWGAPRSGGRSHQGIDIFGPYGTPVYAFTSGVVAHQYNALGGISLVIRGDNGNSYYYAHLSGYSTAAGARVATGQQIGANGNSGNAASTPPHVHFEKWPGGGAAVNPYTELAAACF